MKWFSKPVRLGLDFEVLGNGDVQVNVRWPDNPNDAAIAKDMALLVLKLSNGDFLALMQQAIATSSRRDAALGTLDILNRYAEVKRKIRQDDFPDVDDPVICPTKVFDRDD